MSYIFQDRLIDGVDCSNTVDGVCHNTKTLKECIQLCSANPDCKNGYFIKRKNGGNECAPLYRQDSVYYLMRKQPETLSQKSFVFSSKKDPFPPPTSNRMYFGDNLMLDKNGKRLSISDDEKALLQTQGVIVHFLSSRKFMALKSGDDVVINIPNTAYMLSKDPNSNNMIWIKSSTVRGIKVYGVNTNVGDILNYTDSLFFRYENAPISFDGNLTILPLGSDDVVIKAIPKVKVYYCEFGRCKSVSLEDTEMKGEDAFYKGERVYRSPNCWDKCLNRLVWRILFGIFVFCFILLVMLVI